MHFALLLIFAFYANLSADIPSENGSPEQVLGQYIEAIKSGDWEHAESCWDPEELEKSRQLGIEFKNINVKFDCVSILLLNREKLQASGFEYKIEPIADDDSTARLLLNMNSAGSKIPALYHARYSGDRWYLISPLSYYASAWKTIPGKYINLHVENPAFFNDRAINGLDSFVYSICNKLNVPEEQMAKLSQHKLDYYLCGRKSFENIAGATAEGMVYLPMDAVVSRHIFHVHELSHMLVNYALESPHLYTVPLFQEGLAVYMGGRWGKAPGVMVDWGVFMIRQDLCSVEQILSYDGFYSTDAMADITYPVAGLFCRYIIEKYGMDKFIGLYNGLSGSFEEIKGFTNADIKGALHKHLGFDWNAINSGFADFVESYKFENLIAGSDMVSFSVNMKTENGTETKIGEDENYYHFQIYVPDSLFKGALLLYADGANNVGHYKSILFDEQIGDNSYDGALFGILFDRHEIGLYDYSRNFLTAKHIRFYQPDMVIFDPEDGCIKFRLKKEMLPDSIDRFRCEIISR